MLFYQQLKQYLAVEILKSTIWRHHRRIRFVVIGDRMLDETQRIIQLGFRFAYRLSKLMLIIPSGLCHWWKTNCLICSRPILHVMWIRSQNSIKMSICSLFPLHHSVPCIVRTFYPRSYYDQEIDMLESSLESIRCTMPRLTKELLHPEHGSLHGGTAWSLCAVGSVRRCATARVRSYENNFQKMSAYIEVERTSSIQFNQDYT